MWLIALKTLLADRRKLWTALIGVAFSVVLVNVQGGLFLGLIRKASLLVDHNDADIWVGHKYIQNVDFPRDIPRRWGSRIRGLPGVRRAEPYVIGHSAMTMPDGRYEPVFLIGCDPASMLGNAWRIKDGDPAAIRRPDGVIVDVCDAERIADPQVGDLREIGRHRVRVVARCEGILGFLVTPFVFMSNRLASDILDKPADVCSYWLVELEPGADSDHVSQMIRQRLPAAGVYSKDAYAWLSILFWIRRTGVGISFGAATLLGLLVGMTVVAQTLYQSVSDHLSEYGTLKAIGATSGQIGSILCQQAVIIAAAGSAVGLGGVTLIHANWSTPRAPITIPWYLSLGSCAMVMMICILASALPYFRIRRIDPARILQQ